MDVNQLSTPINKTAALVTNQSGCTKETEYVRLTRRREDLKTSINSMQALIDKEKDPKKKKDLGRMKLITQAQIKEVNEELKLLRMQRKEKIDTYIIRECMKRFSPEEWEEIREIANAHFRREGL